MSCADIALVDEQGLSINHAIASTASAMLMKLLGTKDLQHHCAYVSLNSGTTFVYNSPRILTDYLKKMEFVSAESAEEKTTTIRRTLNRQFLTRRMSQCLKKSMGETAEPRPIEIGIKSNALWHSGRSIDGDTTPTIEKLEWKDRKTYVSSSLQLHRKR